MWTGFSESSKITLSKWTTRLPQTRPRVATCGKNQEFRTHVNFIPFNMEHENKKVFSRFAAIAIFVEKIVPVRSTMVGEMGCR